MPSASGNLSPEHAEAPTQEYSLSQLILNSKFGWLVRFPLVFALTLYLKLKYWSKIGDYYRDHQKEFFKYQILEDGSDKFYSIRKKVAQYAYNGTSKNCLDVGTGHGFQAKALQDMGIKQVVGIDLVQERIEYCKRTFATDRINFEVMDATDLSYPDKFFDCSTVCAVLHDMPIVVRRKAIAEIARVTKNKIVIFEPRTLKNPIGAFIYGTLGALLDESLHFKDYVKDDLMKLLNENGLEVLDQEIVWHKIMSITVCRVRRTSSPHKPDTP